MERIRPGSVATAPASTELTLTDDGVSYTISEFCVAERLGTPTYHKIQKLGLGPEILTVPGTRLVRITAQARREWQERMRALSANEDAKLEARRRQEQASMAGKLGAASPLHVSRRTK